MIWIPIVVRFIGWFIFVIIKWDIICIYVCFRLVDSLRRHWRLVDRLMYHCTNLGTVLSYTKVMLAQECRPSAYRPIYFARWRG